MCKSFKKSSFSYRRQFSPTHTAQAPTPETHSAKSTKTIPPKKDNTALQYRRPFPASRENHEKEKATQDIYTRKKSTIFPELTRAESQKTEHKSDVFSPKTKNKSDTKRHEHDVCCVQWAITTNKKRHITPRTRCLLPPGGHHNVSDTNFADQPDWSNISTTRYGVTLDHLCSAGEKMAASHLYQSQ